MKHSREFRPDSETVLVRITHGFARPGAVPRRALLVMTAAAVLSGLMLWLGCRTVPISGRTQYPLLLSESQESDLGRATWEKVVARETPSSDERAIELVNQIGERIAQAARRDYDWEFRVFASSQQNAFALPGGKVAVYEGLLSICENEAGLAAVIAHEIAHVVARHGGERMGQEAVVEFGERIVESTMENHEERDRRRLMTVYGLGATYGAILPFSRKHETEADEIGMVLMARAGYDPREAIRFWERFTNQQPTAQLPELLSTHPADERRADALRNALPKAMAEYEAAPVQLGYGEPISQPDTAASESLSPSGR